MAKKKKNKKKIPIEEGVCPICGGLDLERSDYNLEDNSVGFEWTCPDCDSSGVEWHRLKFSMHTTRSIKGIPKIESFDVDA